MIYPHGAALPHVIPGYSFPDGNERYAILHPGITVRQLYALVAMHGLLAGRDPDCEGTNEGLAQQAYDIADVMIEADK